jgi:benzoyl-CoA reductase/2-hydroxyglutaryl-CoA dehydratase subunit BcrC/BadD/HgdB
MNPLAKHMTDRNRRLAEYIENRPGQLMEAREKGLKIIASFPGNYVPEEIIFAAGAIPICLIHAGSAENINAAQVQVPEVMCSFSRAQIGELSLKTNPFYSMIDMLIAPITCQHLKKTAEIWEYRTDIDLFKLGVPSDSDIDFSLEYFIERLNTLKQRVEAVTGNKITDQKLHEAIGLYNRMRYLLRKISMMRRGTPLSISSSEFIFLNHASYYADPEFMVDFLEKTYKDLENTSRAQDTDNPRILLIGPNMAYGDDTIYRLVEQAGVEIAIEELCEGIRYYWSDIKTDEDPIQSLAQGYLRDRLPCAFMRRSVRKRFDFSMGLVNDFNISGVIWYELLGCETYDSESYFFEQKMREKGIPMLIIESDYGAYDLPRLRTRVEAFVEQIKGV